MDIKALQRPLRDRYASDPDSAPITLSVRSAPTDQGTAADHAIERIRTW